MGKIMFACLIGFVLMLQPSAIYANGNDAANSDFTNAVNEKLKEASYYHNGSAQIIESVSKQAEVTTVVSKDDPNTEENEEKIESITSNVVVALVEYKLQRDGIFYIKKRDFYYYDVDNKEFLLLSNFPTDDEIKSFITDHSKDLTAGLQTGSNLLAAFLLLLVTLLSSLLIMMFHNKSIPLPIVRRNSVQG
ncbi:hypothetical protein [Fredinandcohnia quinoae]|uniref:Uncharacterized protein n=1 Tax=Fredinandcohnia quinoae TaxID=2918902 RepID=A0AAW5DXV6_9BACI|nr:hypothetical protein [Fredinandcohnia sp. SECRCQ15]MCH1625502.1 hypothetical protein [Fredinandcohnia sp. SECRCQ15]